MEDLICECGCTVFMHLGTLGNREHVRCRDCGLDTSYEVEPEDDCDDDGRFSTDAEADEDAVGPEGMWDDAAALASAGWGTDEDYNHYDYGDY